MSFDSNLEKHISYENMKIGRIMENFNKHGEPVYFQQILK